MEYDSYSIGCQLHEEYKCACAVEAAEAEKSLFWGGQHLKAYPADLADTNYLGKAKVPYNYRKGRLVGKVKVAVSMLGKRIVGEEKGPES